MSDGPIDGGFLQPSRVSPTRNTLGAPPFTAKLVTKKDTDGFDVPWWFHIVVVDATGAWCLALTSAHATDDPAVEFLLARLNQRDR